MHISRNKLLEIDNIDDLENLCQENKTSYLTCKSKSFWKDKYNKEELPFYKYHRTFHLNILEYKYAKKCSDETNKILQFLVESSHFLRVIIRSPDNVTIFNNDDITELSLKTKEFFIDISYSIDENIFYVKTTDDEYSLENIYYILYDIIYKNLSYSFH